MTHDARVRQLVAVNVNMAVPWFVMASFAYYHLDESLLSDGLYDELATILRDRWDTVQHRHKSIILPQHLEAGSLFDVREEDYPTLAKDAAKSLLRGPRRKRTK